MERDLHYYHEQSMHKDEVIDRLLSEFQTKMQQEKQDREHFLTNILPNIAAATTLGIVFAPIAALALPVAVVTLPIALPLFATASLVKQLQRHHCIGQ